VSRIESFHFGVEISLEVFGDAIQLDERRVSDKFQDIIVGFYFFFHKKIISQGRACLSDTP